MTVENNVVLYVFSDEYEEAKGIYEDMEISDFFNYYIESVIESVEKHYTIYEKIEYHYEYIGLLMKFYKKYHIESDLEIDEFLNIYNEIAPDKLFYEKIEVDEDNQQVVTDFIFEYGIDKYKKHKGEDLLPKVEVIWDRPNKDSLILNEYQKDVEKIVEYILIQEIDRVYKDYCAEQLLFEKYYYLQDLLTCANKIEDFRYDKIDVLTDLQRIYNEEFVFTDSEIIVNLSCIA
ncbi:hypothetical protein D8062_00315 [Staphylococcus aureus]|jgi:hypothetical protein|uniref:hypothetical protein n=1 Tax=Staphylococcus TaxID=1279 RepID=UPI000D1FAAB2|nr:MULTISPECIES: hypothetical protein [Staphylococcus]PTK62028.1 hypothetical protein BUZ36_04960 [Staphylococcus haemolyticus]RIL76766.1 hypothetical protein BUY37_03200 [Staphylococcus cohnii]RLL61928.1 hypothetical protein D8062_00315 [Staphylococcus aureus]CAC7179592.1 Uncharacterised protein [Staphylococcus aureus]HAR4860527.1 hypothetical protein [Staphylococcus aureus]